MKNIFYPFIALIIVLTSCKKEDDTTNNSNSSTINKKQQISMFIDGVPFSYTSTGATNDGNKATILTNNNGYNFSFNVNTNSNDGLTVMQINTKLDTLNTLSNTGVLNSAMFDKGSESYNTIYNTKGKFQYQITKKNLFTTNEYLVEGSFSGVLYNTLKTDSVVLSNGQIKIVD